MDGLSKRHAGCLPFRGQLDIKVGVALVVGNHQGQRQAMRKALQPNFYGVVEIGDTQLLSGFDPFIALVEALNHFQSHPRLVVNTVVVMRDLITLEGYNKLRQIFPSSEWETGADGNITIATTDIQMSLWGPHLHDLSHLQDNTSAAQMTAS